MGSGRGSILVTGASGFVGSHLVEAALEAGFDVWAGLRTSSSRQWLDDSRINFITLSLDNSEQLAAELKTFAERHDGRGWDYVVHVAGATKARTETDFVNANCEATRNLAETLIKVGVTPKRFVLMSSLSAESPATAYGRSKLKAEECIKLIAGQMDCIILRPTGVYGPRERDYFLMAKSIKRHIDFSVGFKPQFITFIYVKDLCSAALLALNNGLSGDVFPLSDGFTYSSRDFSQLLQKELGVRRVLHITTPLWLLKAVCYSGQWLANFTHRLTALNKDKYNILKQRDWRCDISHAISKLGFRPEYNLARGVAETVAWYKEKKWI